MRRDWELEDLLGCWTLTDADRELFANKYGPTLLGFTVMLKYFEIDARFPRRSSDVPVAAVEYVAAQLRLEPGDFTPDYFTSRSVKEHRAQIRGALGSGSPPEAMRTRWPGGWLVRCAPVS